MVLTVGNSVDGNVIIYERIKEEIKAGKTVKAAIDVILGHLQLYLMEILPPHSCSCALCIRYRAYTALPLHWELGTVELCILYIRNKNFPSDSIQFKFAKTLGFMV